MRRAFTLIELIVAILVMVILGGLLVPRLATTTRMEHEAAIDAVEDLLASYAFREAMSSGQQVALWQDPKTGDLSLLVKGSALSTNGALPEKQEWVPDPISESVHLPPALRLVDVVIDGEPVTGNDWMAPSVPGGGRPSIELTLQSDLVEATVSLPSSAMTPLRQQEGKRAAFTREQVDLDSGVRGERW